MLGLHRLDEPFGQRDRHGIAGFAVRFQPYEHQRGDRRQHGETPVERIGDPALDIPVRLRAQFRSRPRTRPLPRLGSAVNLRNRKSSIGPLGLRRAAMAAVLRFGVGRILRARRRRARQSRRRAPTKGIKDAMKLGLLRVSTSRLSRRCSHRAAQATAPTRAPSSTRSSRARSSRVSTIWPRSRSCSERRPSQGQFTPGDWYYVSRDTNQLAFRNPRVTKQTIMLVRFDQAGNVASVQKTGKEYVMNLDPSKRTRRRSAAARASSTNCSAISAPSARRG